MEELPTKRLKMDHDVQVNDIHGDVNQQNTKDQEEPVYQENEEKAPKIKKYDNSSPPDPVPGRCHFYLQRKHRYCKTIPSQGNFCVEHSHISGVETGKRRIPCPLDPKHTCYETHLQKHLKKCNARKELSQRAVYYIEGINVGSDDGEDPNVYKVGVRSVSADQVLSMVESVHQLHQDHVDDIAMECLFHPILQEEADKPTNGSAAQKHIQQQASLIGHMKQAGLLEDNHIFVEFGAGKGGLSHWVQLALQECAGNKYVLIDRSSVRYKMDSYHKGEDQGPSFVRIKIDIQHLHLGKLENLEEDKPLIGLGKHLCGGATDLMLRCLVETTIDASEGSHKRPVGGIVLAVCCHHRCDWKSYVGKQFFKDCGLNARDFHLIVSMTSWATCATKPVYTAKTDSGKSGGIVDVKTTDNMSDDKESVPDHSGKPAHDYNHERYGSLLPQERELIGEQCKNLIDQGRLKFLQQRGFSARLVKYIDKQHTLENTAIIAIAQNPS